MTMRQSTSPYASGSAEKSHARATVAVAMPGHLCRVQAATRELCRSVDLDESSVFQAVIAVSELAHRFFVEGAQCGDVELFAVRRKNGLSLGIRAQSTGATGFAMVRASLKFPLTAASPLC